MNARQVLERWSQERIQYAPATGAHDAYGQRLYGPSQALAARIDYHQRLVRMLTGEERMSTVQVYVATDLVIGVLDRITLPDGREPVLLSVERLADYQGARWMTTLSF